MDAPTQPGNAVMKAHLEPVLDELRVRLEEAAVTGAKF